MTDYERLMRDGAGPDEIRDYLFDWDRHELVELIMEMRYRLKSLEK